LNFTRVHIAVDYLKKLRLPSLIHLGQIWSTLGTLKDHLKGSHGKKFPCMEFFSMYGKTIPHMEKADGGLQ